MKRWKEDRLRVKPRGRPARRSHRDERNKVIRALKLMGPHVGVPTIQGMFPDMARREVEDLVRRYKRLLRSTKRRELHSLNWLQPGTVWSMDHADPPTIIDGAYSALWAARDLASRKKLAWIPVTDKSYEALEFPLHRLFAKYGAPLVIKADNGSAYISKKMDKTLARKEVTLLLSPPRTPRYNGSCEAGIASMKRHTEHQAKLMGRSSRWTTEDCEIARCLSNLTVRPWGPSGPTPEEVWKERKPITDELRARFRSCVLGYRNQFLEKKKNAQYNENDKKMEASIMRQAITRALIECDLLSIRRRRIPLPLKSLFSTDIS
jgi:transposase InsO family protein